MFRTRRRLFVHLLSLALLIAQLGMAAHAYSHLKADSDGLPTQTQTQTQSCTQCLSFTPLLGMVGNAHCAAPIDPVDSDQVPPAAISSFLDAASWPAFRSRAPPRFL